ncbi:MAG: hypothetical protein ACYS6W_06550 [Planctomycetota bacterium]|jgi:hypothetical protein
MAKKQDEVVNLVNSLFEVEKHFLELLLDFVPEEARKHLRAARREKLLAVRAILDAKIKDIEKKETTKGKRKPQKVKVE